jgi:plasmid stability protein
MANLTIRNINDDVVERLKEKARQHGRSLEAEIRATLAEAAGRLSRTEFVKLADKVAAMTPKDVKRTDSTKIIRWYRDHR